MELSHIPRKKPQKTSYISGEASKTPKSKIYYILSKNVMNILF